MKIGRRFNQLTFNEYLLCIDNYKKYSNFNTLGLYRSLLENENLTIAEKIEVRDYAHKTFKKAFNFFQLKDPQVYVEVSTLGETITEGDKEKLWADIRKNQQQILGDKRIRHRNFGTYSKHNCPYNDCIFNGIMIRQGSVLSHGGMHFYSDRSKYGREAKFQKRKLDRKQKRQIINHHLLTE
ncbi:hypothetical protein EOD41_18420 [Mucilaginibacter limnophilus]|uniref:Uncharacterized protein n=1 Tax=Mucilaginibacter limnophilus TaxID=1932778 RepID=A0A437MKA9_9SPHI|nr:hypothetical protein [Mucilaginibacter limnophilus]RVT98063.1 hypothetical protein EOD41_18420 [Mucilaginibacter limnophilus]